MASIDEMYQVWSKARAFEISGEVYPTFFLDSVDDETEDMLSVSRVSEDGLIFEEFITYEMVENGKITDNLYTLEVESNGEKMHITPLFYAGKARRNSNA